jgi:hypothetical protein
MEILRDVMDCGIVRINSNRGRPERLANLLRADCTSIWQVLARDAGKPDSHFKLQNVNTYFV